MEQEETLVLRTNTDVDYDLKQGMEVVEVTTKRFRVLNDGRVISETLLKDIKRATVESGIGIARLEFELESGAKKEVAYFTKKKITQFRALAGALTNHDVGSEIASILKQSEEREQRKRSGTLLWLLRFMEPYKTKLAAGIAMSILVAAFNLAPPYLLKVLIDNVLLAPSPPKGLFAELSVVLLLSYAGIAISTVFQNYILNTLGQKVVNDMRWRVYDHTMNMQSSFIERMTTGRILSRLTNDVGNTQWLMVWGVPLLTVNVLTLIGISIILFALNAGLAIFVLIPVPFIIFALISYRRRSFMTYHRNWRRSADVTAMIADTVPAYQVVKSFVREGREAKTLGEHLDRLYRSQVDAVKMNVTYWPALGFLTSLATVSIWWIGGNEVLVGGIQIGIITAFVAYMALFYAPINNLSNIVPFIQQGTTSGDRLREIIESEPEIKSKTGATKPSLLGDIVFDKVTFGYEPFNPVIRDFDLRIAEGQRIAIIGRSGSGKTSISRLLMRFYDVNSGSVSINGYDLRDVDLKYLRGRIAYVPQEVVLFNTTVAKNVAYGEANEEVDGYQPLEVLKACKLAGIHKEVMQLPFAYDTDLGEKGESLSGGQRQRISLARAIIKKPDIFILDEATSDLDVLSEREIYRRMLKLAEGKTTVLVTHNIFEAMSVENVIVMRKGRILEQGTPRELLERGKEFNSMFREYNDENPFKFEEETMVADLGDVTVKVADLDPKLIEVREGGMTSRVDVRAGADSWKLLQTRLPYPLSHPEVVILEDGDGHEVLVIPDMSNLETESRGILERAARSSSYVLRVKAVDRISIRGDELEWYVTTEHGKAVVNTRGRRNVVLMDHKVILVDPYDNISEIDLGKMDKKSLRIINRTI